MWYEEFTNKHDIVQYRFYEKYKDPLTDKWKRVSVVMNKNGKQSQKEAQKRLNERIKEKLNDKTPSTLKTLTFHQACDEWFENYKTVSGSKLSSITTIDGTIQWTKDKDNHIGIKDTTKTEASYRTISLTTRSCEILKKVMLENKKSLKWGEVYVERGFIFTNFKGSPLMIPSINRVIQKACTDIGIEKHVTTHTMRHTHISLLSQLGVSLKAIMQRVGHTDHKTTLQIYSHVTEQMDKDMMNKLEAVSS